MDIINQAKKQALIVSADIIYYDFIELYIDNAHSDIKECFYDYMDAYVSIDIDSFKEVLDFNEIDLYIETLVNETIKQMKHDGSYSELVGLVNFNLNNIEE